METTEAEERSLSQLRMGDPFVRAALRAAASPLPAAPPKEHASTRAFPCASDTRLISPSWLRADVGFGLVQRAAPDHSFHYFAASVCVW